MIKKSFILYLCIIVCILSLNLNIFAANNNVEQSWYLKYNTSHMAPETPDNGKYDEVFDVISIDKSGEKTIYLTFDAGYENGNLKKTLEILNKNDVTGAFFVLPHLIKSEPELIKELYEHGNLICNHTYSHRNMATVTSYDEFCRELSENERVLREVTGLTMEKYYRPPEGKYTEANLEFAQSYGYKTVFWSLAYADWDNNKQMSPEKALDILNTRIHPGCVLLLHPTSDTNVKILDGFIKNMKNDGYTFKSLDEFPTHIQEKGNTE